MDPERSLKDLGMGSAEAVVLSGELAELLGRPVEVCFGGDEERFRVEVCDAGDSVDPREVPEVDLKQYATERRTGGLGVHLMGKIMDSVTFHRSGGHNVCCLEKQRPDVPPR